MRRGANEILVFNFTHFNILDQKLYAAKKYTHVTEEGEDDSLFVLAEAVIPSVSAGAIGPLTVYENIVLMVHKQTMPQFYYQVVRQIYVRKTRWSFYVKGLLSTEITIQNKRMYLDRARLIPAQVIGGERVLFAPGNLKEAKEF